MSFQLTGIVRPSMRVNIDHENIANSLDLNTPQKNLKIATIQESSTSKLGYKLTMSSKNKGLMVAENVPNVEAHSYEIRYNGKLINLSGQANTPIHSVESFSDKASDLTISYPASKKSIDEVYSDTVRLIYTAN